MEGILKCNTKVKVNAYRYRCECGFLCSNNREYLYYFKKFRYACPKCATEVKERELYI